MKKKTSTVKVNIMREAVHRVPIKGAINKARRLQIHKKIFELMNGGQA